MRTSLALLLLASVSSAQSSATPSTTHPIRFTTDEGTWISLDVSPDGRTVAFELLGDIYSIPMTGGKARPIHTGTAFQSQPRYSPDGGSLVFVSDEGGADNLWVSGPNGEQPRKITNLWRETVVSPEWAADGKSVYATVFEGRTADLWRYDLATGKGERVVANANGPASLLVSTPPPGPYGANLSHDGAWLYYTSVTPRPYGSRNGPSSRLMRRRLTGGPDEPVVVEQPIAMKSMLSPDGALLVYGAQARGRTGFRVRDLATGDERWLRFPIQRNELEARASRDVLPNYAFTPDGRAIVAAYDGKIHRITIATAADTVIPFSADVALDVAERLVTLQRVETGPVRARILQQPAISGDGRVAFSTLGRIYVAPPTGVAPKRLTTSDAAREFMPAWSPDGAWIAFVTWDQTGGAVWRVRSAGGVPERLTKAPAFFADPVWTPDGSAIVALRAPNSSARSQPTAVPIDAAFVRVPSAGGAYVVLAPANGARHPHFAGEPARLFVSAPDGLASMALDGSDRRVHARGPSLGGPMPSAAELRASPDGKSIALAIADRLYRFPTPATGATPALLNPDDPAAPVSPATRGAPSGFAWSSDGQSLAWITGQTLSVAAATGAVRTVALSVSAPRPTPNGTVVLRGARVITMRDNEVIPAADVVVTGDRISAIGARGSAAVPADARIIDVSGKTIIPGIIDIHEHQQLRRELLEPEAPPLLASLAFGVTTFRDPQTSPDIFAYADLVAAEGLPSPRIYSTGPGLFAETNLQSLDDARRLLRRYRDDYGTRLLKSYQIGNRQQRQWVVQASRELGMMPTTEGGADTKMDLTHAMDGFSGNEHSLPTAPIYRDVIELLARSGITYTPTIIVSFGGALPVFRLHANERPSEEPKLRRFFPADELYARTATRLLAFPEEDYNDKETAAGAAAVLAAGGHVALGGHGEMQGLQVHWEMQLLAGGGMRPHDILKVATINSAEAIGLSQDLGSIETGKLADLLVLDRDPLADIRATTAIRYVMQGGVLRDGASLDRVWPQASPLPVTWWQQQGGARPALDPGTVDAVVRDEMQKQRIPGVAVAVVRGSHTLLAKGYGFANLEDQIRVTDESMFESGSLGKMFTAAGVMSLVEAGTIALDSSVRAYLPDAPATWQAITIRHMLSHSSGIPDYTSDALDYRRDYTEADFAKMAFAMPLEFAPGQRWNYSNTNYVVLGIIISKLGGRPYWETLREKIFTPTGMPTVRVISEADVVPHRVAGYLPTENGWQHQNWVAPITNTTADGSLLLSLRDMIAWAGTVRARGVLSAESWTQMQSPVTLNSGKTHPYGFGWFIDLLNGQRVVQHGGSWQGFRTQMTRFEGSDLTVIVLTNSGAANPAIIASRIGAALDPALVAPAVPTTPIVDDPRVTSYLRDVLGKIAGGTLAVQDFEFVRATVVPRMSAAYAKMLQPMGAVTRLELVAKGDEGDDRTFKYRVAFANGAMVVTLKLGPGGRMTGISLVPPS